MRESVSLYDNRLSPLVSHVRLCMTYLFFVAGKPPSPGLRSVLEQVGVSASV
jgi:hypothetical protein